MRINSFKAREVHDYLNYDIDFSSNITFLIGINGSGKTSALKLILGLTSPSYNYLNQIKYSFCEVICSSNDNERDIIIRAEQYAEYFTFSLEYNNQPILIDSIKRFIRNPKLAYTPEEIISGEQRAKEAFELNFVTQQIRTFVTPKFLGLDRRIYEGSYIDSRFNRNKRNIISSFKKIIEELPEAQAIDLSLDEVQDLIFNYIRRLSTQQILINEEFKESVFNESFEFTESINFEDLPSPQYILERRQKVLDAIEGLGLKGQFSNMNKFFNKMVSVAEEYDKIRKEEEKDKDKESGKAGLDIIIKYFRNSPQLKRIDDIIQYSQDYQKKLEELRAPIKKLENIVTNFLKEGKKELIISSDGEMKIKLKNKNFTNIYSLSSGEKQIIIMIAHLIFEEAEKDKGVFIIDEPEISLHIAWQQIFVQSILEASPKTQFILATHSPAIISNVGYEQFCQDLNKLNF